MHHHMGRAQYAKGSKKGHLCIGRNNACRANAVEIDLSVRVATLCNRTSSLTPQFSKNLDEIYEKVFENPEGGFNKGFAFISKGFIGFYQDFELIFYTSFSWFY
jgi:hypothetical protein